MEYRSASVLLISRDSRIWERLNGKLAASDTASQVLQVKTFSSGLQALKHQKFDLVVLEATVPGYGRADQVRMLLELSPDSAVVLAIDPTRAHDCDASIASAYLSGAQDAIPITELEGARLRTRLYHAIARARACSQIRRAHQSASEHVARMAMVGALTARIGHELKQPLTFVDHSLSDTLREIDLLIRDTSDQPGLPARLQEVQTRLRRMQSVERDTWKLLRELNAFSRRDEEPARPVRPDEVLESALLLTQAEISARARIERQIEPAPSVLISPLQLKQVLVNLLLNAAQALSNSTSGDNRIRITLRGTDRGWAQIEIADSGPGIPGGLTQKIFEPFFTTKAAGEGTGLGLAIAKEIIESAGGRLGLVSEPSSGATFQILLPPADGLRAMPARTEHRLTLLLIEDDPKLLRMLESALSPEYEIVCVRGAEEAVQMILQGILPFDAVLCDVNLGEYSGIRVYQQAVNANPDLRSAFIFMTGGACNPEALQFLQDASCVVLEKPFSLEYLNQVVLNTIQKRVGKL
jgi:signal transduction histidine kinase/ActR/RegA family two-component response regulator